ncbi:MAG TPA: PQQ-binding-like beta-propeller repeat protein [Longimicrobium sp.]|nr:PQQ-binding-like beta-propeller repeat protein [Longimicrobium sp.]
MKRNQIPRTPGHGRAAALALLTSVQLAACGELLGGSSDGGGVVWAVAEASGFHGIPAVDGAHVYVEGDTGLAAFDQATGRKAWEPRLATGGGSQAVVFRAGRLYSAEVEVVRAYDATTGAVIWSRPFPSQSGPDFGASAVDDAAVYVGTRDHRVLALNAANGATLWEVDVGRGWTFPGLVAGVSVSGDTVYAAVKRNLNPNGFEQAAVIVALQRSTGAELWRYQSAGTKSNVISAPVVADSLLVAADLHGNSMFAVDRATGSEVWRVLGDPSFVGPYGAPAVANGVAYMGSGDTRVHAVDLATGRVKWRSDGTGASIRAVGVCGDRVIVNNDDIQVLDRRTGKRLGVAMRSSGTEFATSGVAVAGGRAFIAGTRKVYAVSCE